MKKGLLVLLVFSILFIFLINSVSAGYPIFNTVNLYEGHSQLIDDVTSIKIIEVINNSAVKISVTSSPSQLDLMNLTLDVPNGWLVLEGIELENPLDLTTISLIDRHSTCFVNWQCSNWSICKNSIKNRTCYNPSWKTCYEQPPARISSCTSFTPICIPDWNCTNWSSCANSKQTRTCNDNHKCNSTSGKPPVFSTCVSFTPLCVQEWNCTNWSSCANSKQTRTCNDNHKCNSNSSRPSLSNNCTSIKYINLTKNSVENEIIRANESSDESPALDGGTEELLSEENPEDSNTGASDEATSQNNEINSAEDISNGEVNEIEGEDETEIKLGDYTVKTDLGVTKKNSKLYLNTSNGTLEIKISPEIASVHIPTGTDIRNIEIKYYKGKAIYIFHGLVDAKLLFVFPVLAEVDTGVNVEDGKLVYTKKPGWAFLASGV